MANEFVVRNGLFVTSGSVGIGTTSPTATLDVNGTGRFSSSVTAGTLISDQTNGGTLFFKSSGTNTGLFTTTNQISGSGSTSDLNAYVYGANQFGIWTNGTQRLTIASTGAATFSSSVTATSFNGTTNNIFSVDNTERMRITSGGNVGIGTTSPSYKFDVQNSGDFDIRIKDTTLGGTVGVLFEANNDFSGTSQAYVKAILGGSNGQSTLIFGTATNVGDTSASEKMRITSGGNVLIGTTTDDGTSKLQVNGAGKFSNSVTAVGGLTVGSLSSGSDAIINLATNASGSPRSIIYRAATAFIDITNTAGTAVFQLSNGGAATFSSLGTGTVYSNAGTLTNTNPSDFNLKENIKPINYGLNEILKLNAVSFNWKDDKINQGKQYGFIAQDVQKIMPDLVKEGEYLGLDKEAIFTILVKAIQELTEKVNQLENK